MLIRSFLLLLVLGATLPFGSVQTGPVLLLELGALLVLALTLVGTDHRLGSSPKARRLIAICLAVCGVGVVQLWRGQGAPPDTIDALLRFVAYGFIGLAAFLIFRRGRGESAAMALVALASFQAFYGAFEFLSGRQHIFAYEKIHYLDSATGTFINRNHFAVYLAMSLPFAIELIEGKTDRFSARGWRDRLLLLLENDLLRRVLPLLAVFVILTGVLLSFSRGGAAAACIAVGVYLMNRRRRGTHRLLIALLLLLPIILLTWQAGKAPGERFLEHPDQLATLGERLPTWKVGLSMVPDRPLLGTGLGTFEEAFHTYQPAQLGLRWDHIHNDFLQFLIEGGAVTLLLAVLFVVTLFKRSSVDLGQRRPPRFRAAVAGGLAAILFHSLLDFPLRIPAIAALSALLVGLYLATEPTETASRFPRAEA